ncbi:MAG: ABC transporter transmembrane domain-containing protein [Zymomonas mobilis subsp. pomaceae]|uniref:Lipid A ABC exporter family, fused ATPase and inner membrane subunits n=1 Tax=Zymomonas mobilis subsp. pomaceae (strain ATCC 29192 / DSM 22645 / JCM 10191 / CCUG 17912 / NBRC 13757 / NCIMB 11200 / NRRL B-4491 / Barker I) TaxID=579138 RepID=F8EUT1_ZYMMT|nr:ABC transporter transmembrane domain-containing protein [Zymomonas mobilis]AEI38227.1 lipid A ABC exporter family, fused ATPase and inner membrane subunits [Zymomonas mobilis subsp. pomaceae ATCC 29192]MDX5947917.1 ABC transporter transmembrane domain-containing protein [Zymomonas mobilis subsp. pomaceae]GEB89978.1 ABC transporter ATP-binding protein [Zymomonas mobilis subsp. pomaceae]
MARKTESTLKKKRDLSQLRMIWQFASRYPGWIVAALFALILSSTATISIPAGFRLVIDRGFNDHSNSGDINRYFCYLLGIVVVLAFATAVRFYCVSWLGERVIADIRTAVDRHLMRMPPVFFEHNRPSEIASRITTDTTLIDQIISSTVSVALRNLITGLGGTLYLLMLAPHLTALLLLGIPVVVVPIIVLGRRLQKLSRKSQDRIADLSSLIIETLGAIKVVQAFGQETREAIRFHQAVQTAFQVARKRITLRAFMTAIIILLIFTAIILIMWRGTLDVAAGRVSGGTIAAFVLTGGVVAGAFGALSEVYGDLLRGAGAASRLNDLLAEEPAIYSPKHPKKLPQSAEGTLDFSEVSFYYPSRPDNYALKDFNLKVKAGERLAIIGPSGAGKTTLFQLIQRFYDPESGSISLNGIDLREASLSDLRSKIAVVPQETVIFAASARDNLRYGRWDAKDEEIWQAARAANAEEFLKTLPQGLDSFLGEGGARLSGGQRQRIAIARALLRDAPLLLLDEATSALDAQSEQAVQQALEKLMKGRTSIIIAHRLSTIRSADRIIVMDQGKIVEEGTHDQLIAKAGLYARLAQLQFHNLA